MPDKNLKVALRLTADSSVLTRELRKGVTSTHQFRLGVKRELDALKSTANSLAGQFAALGVATGGAAFFAKATRTFSEAEHALRGIGNAGGLTGKQLSSVQRELLGTAQSTNQFREALIGGLDVLVSSGMKFDRAKSLIKDIGYAATGSRAAMEDLAKTAFALDQNLSVLPKDMGRTLNILTNEGFAGAFELKDMARYFPVITAEVQKLHMTGPKAAASIGAALQVSRAGAGTSEEAATNLKDYLTKITSRETTKALRKEFGVRWEKEYTDNILKSDDPLLASVEFFRKKIGENPFNMNKIFGNQQTMEFLNSMFIKDKQGVSGIDRYKKIRDDGLNDPSAIKNAFDANMDTGIEQWKRMGINMEAITQRSETLNRVWAEGNQLLKKSNDILSGENVTLERLAGGGAGLLAGGYAATRIFKGVGGKLLDSLGGTAAGVGMGKMLQEAAGITPVFVVNMPGAGMIGGPGGLPKNVAPAVAGAGRFGAGSVAATALAGVGGYAFGGYAHDNILSEYASDRIGAAIAAVMSPFSEEARKARFTNEFSGQRRKAGMMYQDKSWLSPEAQAGAADTLGYGTAKVLAFFGNKTAKNALAINENKTIQRRYGGIDDHADIDKAIRLAAADNSLVDKVLRRLDETASKMENMRATVNLKVDGPAKVTGMQANGMRLNVDSGLFSTGN